ncbi:MAG TPA: glycoside hydrolase family 2, partial [Vicinamibacteria bacterium]|nr:glycoside hydrolase family 2 [Vicinamibacteria bacterium]
MRHLALVLLTALASPALAEAAIPLPEHPRPDFERTDWVNLNGDWSLRFDAGNAGERDRWFATAPAGFPATIHVPYPWGSALSGVGDEADVAWYARPIRVPEAWTGKRVFLVVG